MGKDYKRIDSTILWQVNDVKQTPLGDELQNAFFKAVVCQYQNREILVVSVRDERGEKEERGLFELHRKDKLNITHIEKWEEETLYHQLINETVETKTTETLFRGYSPYPAASITLRKYKDSDYDELVFCIGGGNMKDVGNVIYDNMILKKHEPQYIGMINTTTITDNRIRIALAHTREKYQLGEKDVVYVQAVAIPADTPDTRYLVVRFYHKEHSEMAREAFLLNLKRNPYFVYCFNSVEGKQDLYKVSFDDLCQGNVNIDTPVTNLIYVNIICCNDDSDTPSHLDINVVRDRGVLHSAAHVARIKL